jgi:uncharacterized protein YbjT (DUF2867 family)
MNTLVCGALLYIDQRLVARLLDERTGPVRLLVRDARRLPEQLRQHTEVIEGDLLDPQVLRQAAQGMDVAYYPVRPLSTDRGFENLSMAFAERFREACIESGVRRIVYFGAQGVRNSSSSLLRGMAGTGEILSARPGEIQTVWLKAGAVIGSGSLFFEMLRHLVRKAPVILSPRWMRRGARPVSIEDAVEFLSGARSLSAVSNVIIDIGAEAVSLEDMLSVTADVMGVKRVFVHVPFTLPRLSSLYLMLLTPLSYRLASTVVQALDAAGSEAAAGAEGPPASHFQRASVIPLRQIIEEAMGDVVHQRVPDRWTDSLVDVSYTFSEDDLDRAVYRDVKTVDFGNLSAGRIFSAVKSVGGKRGWFTFDVLWQIRGLLDKFMGGFGTSVGRRVESDLRIGDMLDVWRVVDLIEDKRLLLEAQMQVFGKAWLEFRIDNRTLTQTAYHVPSGVLGRLYWYSMLPFHAFIFRDMIESIVRRAEQME